MKRRRSILAMMAVVALTALLLTVSVALAQANPSDVTVPYSSRLTDESGRPLDGVYAFRFALYDAETDGRLLWSETQSGVTVQGGALNVSLGAVTSIPKASA